MHRTITGALAGLAALAICSSAVAGIYTDDFSRCLVKSTTPNDNIVLAQWIFAIMSANSNVKSMSSLSHDERVSFERKGALLVQRLVLDDCKTEATAAVRYEGAGAFETSFQLLGTVAMRNLLSDPTSQAELKGISTFLDKDRWAAFSKAAGVEVQQTGAK